MDGEPDEDEREPELEARAFSSGLRQQSEPGSNVSLLTGHSSEVPQVPAVCCPHPRPWITRSELFAFHRAPPLWFPSFPGSP